jgi:hypothetical protein
MAGVHDLRHASIARTENGLSAIETDLKSRFVFGRSNFQLASPAAGGSELPVPRIIIFIRDRVIISGLRQGLSKHGNRISGSSAVLLPF